MVKSKKIGYVKLTALPHSKEERTYSDGDIEDALLNHFSQSSPYDASFSVKHPGWATTYHLSPVRENLLNWVNFKPKSSVLEVGAGCGALTGMLSRQANSVVALELSKRRALINAQRHRSKKNIEVVAGNLQDLSNYRSEKFDYVICVGVLEYAGRFLDTEDPFNSFLQELKKFLKPDGTLILAIENKLGLKYWAGAKEDHVRRYMEGIEDYPHYNGIRTFGKKELSKMLDSTGFSTINFYYPYPDYKLPHTIYSDNYLPGIHTPEIPSEFYPTPTPDQGRQQVLREQLAIRSIANNGLYADLANSFLVLASCGKVTNPIQETVFSHASTSRLQPFRILTRVIKRPDDSLIVRKTALGPGKDHLRDIKKTAQTLAKTPINKSLVFNKCLASRAGEIEFEYVPGQSLQGQLLDSLLTGQNKQFLTQVQAFISLIDNLPSILINPTENKAYRNIFKSAYNEEADCMEPGIVDINFDNLIDLAGKYTLIDYEWTFDFPLPKHYIIARALAYFFQRHNQLVRGLASPSNPCVSLGPDLLIPSFVYNKFEAYFTAFDKVAMAEAGFQNYVNGGGIAFQLQAEPEIIMTELSDNALDSYETLALRLESHVEHIRAQEAEIQRINRQLTAIKNTKVWKIARRANQARRFIKARIKRP